MKNNRFPAIIKTTTAVFALATAVLVAANRYFSCNWLLAVAITAGTTFYHFAMRLVVGFIVPHCVKDPMKHRWFHQKPFEMRLYTKLKVKLWKDHLPTYDPASFSLRENSLEQIVYNSCVSEAVHVVIVLLSFVPVSFALLWSTLPVFLITSVLSAAFDSCFIIMQRYNRPRLLRIISKKEA